VRITAFDLSLTSTGFAIVRDNAQPATGTLTTKLRGYDRLEWLRQQIDHIAYTVDEEATLVVVEGPAFGAKGDAYHQLAGLWWLITWHFARARLPFAIVPPSLLKKYATGLGNASKDQVLMATARRFPDFAGGNDEADALWLAAMGADRLGVPLVQMPAANRAALDKVQWPAVAS